MRRLSLFVVLTALSVSGSQGPLTRSVSHGRLRVEARTGEGQVWMTLSDAEQIWADGPYEYALELEGGARATVLTNVVIRTSRSRLVITGRIDQTPIRVRHELFRDRQADTLCERLALENPGSAPVIIKDLAFGFRKRLDNNTERLRWVGVPFRRQVDGKLHDYGTADLVAGRFSNSNWANDRAVADQEPCDEGKLRSEAWAWTDGEHGLLIAKYNPAHIEHSVATVEPDGAAACLRFGGAGLSLYREPRALTTVGPGRRISFGETRYFSFKGGWPRAYELYRAVLDRQGHGFPKNYSPPLNWNELFDVGWYHSDRAQLFQHYTREALLREAQKARDIGCDLLYLDPGWEICEGTTLWDEERLGQVADFARELKERFGLRLGYRTIGRVYRNEYPAAWHVRRHDQAGEYQRPLLTPSGAPEPAPLFAPDGRRNLALLPEARARASSLLPGFPELHTVAHLNDGYYNNAASWISAQDPSWAEIDLGAVFAISELRLGSEHRVHYGDRALAKLEVRVATDHSDDSNAPSWRKVLTYDGEPIHATRKFTFETVQARYVRVLIQAAGPGNARIDELEIYESVPAPAAAAPVRRAMPKASAGSPLGFWEVCTQCRDWQQEKLNRILAITRHGVDFMMFDEFDWRGPCYDSQHGHPVPSTPEGHVRAVYGLVERMRARCPRVLVEAHDPVWPWGTRYLPTYYGQGFGQHQYQENWGFEFMWNPIDDLRSGRALCLYYYNLGCNIPLYDHITMEADNDACLSFWWYASTVRHLGIGGKKGLNSPRENEPRFAAYKKAVAEYNGLRSFYARGRFVGIDETTHLHLHPTQKAAVVNVFNLTGQTAAREVRIRPGELGLGTPGQLGVEGASYRLEGDALVLRFNLPPMSPAHCVLRAIRPGSRAVGL